MLRAAKESCGESWSPTHSWYMVHPEIHPSIICSSGWQNTKNLNQYLWKWEIITDNHSLICMYVGQNKVWNWLIIFSLSATDTYFLHWPFLILTQWVRTHNNDWKGLTITLHILWYRTGKTSLECVLWLKSNAERLQDSLKDKSNEC